MQVNDLGKIDPRVMTLQTRYLYAPFVDGERPATDRSRLPPGTPARLTDTYGRFDLSTQQVERYFAGPAHSLQECSFVPREGGDEGNGYLVGVCTNYAEQRSELVIADAQRLGDGDVARVLLPFRISAQVHGIWASSQELPLS
jgi:carotenoid cleavage dioxygenase